ncbi:acyltransferase [Peptostreptococcaceae bacterium AGR-M142]
MRVIKHLISKVSFLKYRKKLSSLKNVDIMKKTKIHNRDKIIFGDYVYVGPECEFMGAGGIEIGNNVIFGPKVSIWSENHNFRSRFMVPYDDELIAKPVIIGDNVWCGYDVKITPGTKVGEGAIIGMGAVIRGEIPPCAIVIGNPGEIIGYRDKEIYDRIVSSKGYYYKLKRMGEIEAYKERNFRSEL